MSQADVNDTKKTSGKQKLFAVLGIFFITLGIFLAAFGFSFKLMMFPRETTRSKSEAEQEIDKLKITVSQLEDDNRRLKEENDILKGSATSTTSTSSTGSTSTSSSSTSKSSSN